MKRTTRWGYEVTAIFDGRPGGIVTPPRGALWPDAQSARRACKAGSARVKRVRAVVLPDGSLSYWTKGDSEGLPVEGGGQVMKTPKGVTQGPWIVIEHPRPLEARSALSVGAGSNGMASVAWLTLGSPASESNARLMAAAPELYAVANELIRGDGTADSTQRAIDLAIRALAKAEGKS